MSALHIRDSNKERTYCGRVPKGRPLDNPKMTPCKTCTRVLEKQGFKAEFTYADGAWKLEVKHRMSVYFTSAKVVNLETGEEVEYNAEELHELLKNV